MLEKGVIEAHFLGGILRMFVILVTKSLVENLKSTPKCTSCQLPLVKTTICRSSKVLHVTPLKGTDSSP